MERESPLLSLHVLAASLVRSLVRSAEATADYSFPPSFTFQSQPHEYKEKKKGKMGKKCWPKINNATSGEPRRKRKRARERGRGTEKEEEKEGSE